MTPRSSPANEPFLTACVRTKSIAEVMRWTQKEVTNDEGRLFLPPIQRSAVWRNAQIIGYWDSLLRGYPAGLMMIHRPKEGGMAKGATADRTGHETVRDHDFLLFDGQQRLTAMLLGLGEGQLKERLKLWVDLGAVPKEGSDLKHVLRISSTGQPFGYQVEKPNEKFPRDKRHQMERAKVGRMAAFEKETGEHLFGAVCALPLKQVVQEVLKMRTARAAAEARQTGMPPDEQSCDPEENVEQPRTREEVTAWVLEQAAAAAAATPATAAQVWNAGLREVAADAAARLVRDLDELLGRPVLFQVMEGALVEDEGEYRRFFQRVGQGGTALSDDELTYSLIKHQVPHVHDRMQEIMKGEAGRMMNEVPLVLAALRLAKVLAPWMKEPNWEVWSRPQPDFVGKMMRTLGGVRMRFEELLPATEGGQLKTLMDSLRRRLAYHPVENPQGLPTLLLARLPHFLMDVLLLMEARHEEGARAVGDVAPGETMRSFALYWLLFVVKPEKAANKIYWRFLQPQAHWWPGPGQDLIRCFEEEGLAYRLPGPRRLCHAWASIKKGTHVLRDWEQNFAVLDADENRPTGGAMRALSTQVEPIRCALLWLQRGYLHEKHGDYDPTSGRDDDLPIDLDHLIPSSKYDGDWRTRKHSLFLPDGGENFYRARWRPGNSLGNYRWLDFAENRSRGADEIAVEDARRDHINQVKAWNEVIQAPQWREKEVREFQRLVDLRTVRLYRRLLKEGGLEAYVTDPKQHRHARRGGL